jgi:hypothetical protein
MTKNGYKRIWVSYIKGGNIFTATWSVFLFLPWCSRFAFRLYIGWKLKGNTDPIDDRASIAFSMWPFMGTKYEK